MRPSRARAATVALAAVVALGTALVPAAAATADQIRDAQYWLDDYGVRDAWQVTRGAGVTVAVVDTGVDGSVAELEGAVVGGTDFSGQGSADGQRPVGDDSSHGTLVGSLLAGRGTGTGDGVLGVAPEAELLSVSVGFGAAAADSDQQIADAVRWSVDAGADVINMSLTRNTLDWPTSWDDAFLYAMEHDVVVVAAAGNRGSGTTEVGAPATMPGVLTVAGVDRQGTASFDASSQGITIGVAAPAEDLVGVGPGDVHYLWQGSSGATPLVAGIVALVRSAHPELDADDVIERVVATAESRGTSDPDPLYGHGLVDASAAVSATVAPVGANPMGDLAEWVRLHRRADVPVQATVPPVQPVPAPTAAAGDDTSLAGLRPSVETVRGTLVPLGVLLGFGLALVAVLVAGGRQVMRIRRQG
ncbi:S8 family peptidase [Frigoribacterium salinisoli]